MERIEYRDVVDKAKWPRGPWDNEPDKIQWQDSDTGLPCLIVRGPSGALCGYVGVAEGHPWHGQEYDSCDVDVHGGLTFAAPCADVSHEEQAHAICHIASPGEPDPIWWLGFDCAHSGDLTPASSQHRPSFMSSGTYRTITYVEQECQSLAQQIKAASQGDSNV